MKKIYFILLLILMSNTICLMSQNIVGSWSGELSVQGAKLPIVFNVKSVNDSLVVTMDSPMQGAKNIPTTYAKFENNQLSIKAIQLILQYEGVLLNDTVIDGNFTQGGASLPLKLTKGAVKLKRPQEPLPPFSYNSEDIVFNNVVEGFELAGTLTFPHGDTAFPSVVLISGSGSQNRNEELFEHKPFLVLADYLTKNGIAVLRFDDRGVGQSKGKATNATTKDLSTDARSAMQYLKTRKEIDVNKIGLIGHSEGGCIAFMLAAESCDVSFIVSMAGGAIKGDSLLKEQRYMMGIASSQDVNIISKNEELITQVEGFIEGKTQPEILNEIDRFIDSSLMPIASTMMSINSSTKDMLKREVLKLTSPWMRYFMSYDPVNDLRKIKCPVFAINGSKDLQVKASSNLSSIKENVPHAIVKEYEGLNHLFQTCNTGLINEYGEIEETVSPQVLKDISDWINQVVK